MPPVKRPESKGRPRPRSRRPARRAGPLRKRFGRWALIAGCVEGMGVAYAERLASEGFDLVLLDRERAALQDQARRLEATHGVSTRVFACDLANPRRVNGVLDAVEGLEIGLLVFNAAHGAVGPWAEVPLATKLLAVNLNVTAVLTMADRLSRPMIRRRRGGIVLTSSMAALQGAPGQAVYAATKAFDLILAESLWGELQPHGVDVVGFIPGMVRTPQFERSGAASGESALLRAVEPSEAVDAALGALGREPSVIPGGVWKVVAAAGSLVPRKLMIAAIGQRMRGLKETQAAGARGPARPGRRSTARGR